MKKIISVSVLIALSQFVFAQDKVSAPNIQKINGCVYGDVIYQVGEQHRVQQSVTDPVTKKVIMVDLEPKIVQECIEDKNAEQTKSPQFYWITLQNQK